ncbi:hypothetical protein NDU88_001238 [Pleurodeles waltl]|uniref:Uncharacterized protein n=1 Tax=Pleurodeles waltl TaxID=8319 RepID=A0AAV7U7C1_PLEWA|nr:hypothetical protein NDU88_001238 [Pleurodeles waltl]
MMVGAALPPCKRKPWARRLSDPSPLRASSVGYPRGRIGGRDQAVGPTRMSAGRLRACVRGLEAVPAPRAGGAGRSRACPGA